RRVLPAGEAASVVLDPRDHRRTASRVLGAAELPAQKVEQRGPVETTPGVEEGSSVVMRREERRSRIRSRGGRGRDAEPDRPILGGSTRRTGSRERLARASRPRRPPLDRENERQREPEPEQDGRPDAEHLVSPSERGSTG